MSNSKNIETAVVILNWNGKKHLESFLPSVCRHSQNDGVKIFVADNGSADDSLPFLEQNYPNIECILFDKNYGFAEGYNKALEQIEADYFVILNSDVEVSAGWLVRPIELLKAEKNTVAVAPKILSYRQKQEFEYAGAAGGFIDKYGYPFCRGRIIASVESDTGQYDNELNIFWASGAALFIKSEAFKSAGGFDAHFFAHMEEIDLCWRLKNRGFNIKYTHQSVVWHLGGGSLSQESPFKAYLNHRNNLFMLYKNLPSNKVFLTILKRLFLDGLSALLYLSGLKFRFFAAVVKAHFAFYQHLKLLKQKRKQLEPFVTKKNHTEIFQKSIVIDYFIRKKKSFSELIF